MSHVSRTHRVALDWLLTGFILILKFRFDTLTPNTRLQTFWPKVISHVTNGTIFFVCSTSAISAPLIAPRIPASQAALKRWRGGCRNRREKEELWQNRNQQRWTCLHMFRQVPHSQKSSIASTSPGMLIATGKLESGMRRNSKSDAASSSQVRLQDAYLGGLMDTATNKRRVKPVVLKKS